MSDEITVTFTREELAHLCFQLGMVINATTDEKELQWNYKLISKLDAIGKISK